MSGYEKDMIAMKTLLPSTWARFIAGIVMTLSLLQGAHTASAQQAHENIYNYLQLLRSDFNSVKVDVINRVMNLSEPDAKKFWPIYRDYENELGKQAISRAEFIVEFIRYHAELPMPSDLANERARDMSQRWFASQRARLDLLEKYHGKIQQALSPLQAGQFLQIEHQLALFIDVTIAGEMPAVGQRLQ